MENSALLASSKLDWSLWRGSLGGRELPPEVRGSDMAEEPQGIHRSTPAQQGSLENVSCAVFEAGRMKAQPT